MSRDREQRDPSPDDLLDAAGVTKRERDVLDALADRLTNAELAERFTVSERTIESHVSSLLRKLGATNRTELATQARELAATPRAFDLPQMLRMSVERSRCVGRDPERAALVQCWALAESGGASLVVIAGEAGIGKSRLAAEIATHVHARGGRILLGAAIDGPQGPYQPLIEALTAAIEGLPESQLRSDVGRHVEALARVMPGVAARLGTSTVRSMDPIEERLALHIAIEELVRRNARRHPTMIVVEDVHWASQATRDALLHVARTVGRTPLLLLVTARDAPPDLDPGLSKWLADASRLPITTSIALAGLDVDESAAVLDELESDIDALTAQRATGGNPLFLREMAAGGHTSPTLRDFLTERYARLSRADLDVIDTAAILGDSFRASVIASANGCPVDDVLASLELATAAGLVEPFVREPGRFRFVHALFRSLRVDTLEPSRRMKIHADVVGALLPFADDPMVLPDLARHACIAAPLGNAPAAVDLGLRAGALLAAAGDLEEAARHLQRALDAIDLAPAADPGLRLQLSIRLGEALVGFDRRRGQRILRDAAHAARRLGDYAAFADAVCSMPPFASSVSMGEEDPAFIALAAEALRLLPPDERQWRPRVLALLGAHFLLGTDPPRGEAIGRQATAAARRSGDPLNLAYALLSSRWAPKSDERDDGLREAFAIGEALGHNGVAHLAAEALAISARERGELALMREWHARAVERSPTLTLGGLQHEVNSALLQGDLDLAGRLNERTRERDDMLGTAHLYSGPTTIVIDLWRGRTHRRSLTPFVASPSHVGSSATAMLALSEVVAGDRPAAAELLRVVRDAGLDGHHHRLDWSLVVSMWAEVAAAVGDVAMARQLLPLLEPYAGCLADSRGNLWCSVDFARTCLALTCNDTATAERWAEGAVAASRTRATPLYLGRELIALADARRRRGAPPSETQPLVEEAMAIAEATGATLIRLDAERRTALL